MCAWWNKDRGAGRSTPSAQTDAKRSKEKTPQRVRRVTIGLDFGTSSSKCMFREEGEGRPFRIVGYDNSKQPWGHVLYPSTVSCKNGILRFGHLAEEADGLGVIRSFKMCLRCLSKEPGGESAAAGGTCSRCLRERPGFLGFGDVELSAEDISTLYLAVVLNHAIDRIRRVFGDAEPLRVLVNSAGPLDQLESFGALGECFHRVVFFAINLAGRAKEKWELDAAIEALNQVRQLDVPPRDQSPTVVVPESHAAITGYIRLPQSQKGLYGVVDVGAGTTDVAFFWLQKEPEEKAWYYSAGSTPVGMDDIDLALAPVLTPLEGSLRAAREGLSSAEVLQHQALMKYVIKQMFQFHALVYDDARRVHAIEQAWIKQGWAQYKLFLVGGGTRCTPVTNRFGQSLAQYGWAEEPEQLPVPPRLRVVLPDGEQATLAQLKETAVRPLLLLAYGLATPRPEIPRFDRDHVGVAAPEPDPDRWQLSPDDMFGHF